MSQPDLWEVQGKETIRREPLPHEAADGDTRRFRLTFTPPIVDGTSLVFRFRVPMNPALSATEIQRTIPWVLVEEGSTGVTTVELSMARGIRLTVGDPGWVERGTERPGPRGSDTPRQYRLLKPGAEKAGFPFSAFLAEQVSLPPLVAPRALLRTVLGAQNESRTRAWYWIESHPAHLAFSLPEGARWVRSRIDGQTAEQIENNPAGEGYVLSLPAESQSKPVLVEIEYQVAADRAGSAWFPPRLHEGAVVLQTLWEVQIPWSQALVGVPHDWADENEWYWDLYVWKRKPWRSFPRLVSWVAGATPQGSSLDEVLGEEQEGSHGYLFGRAGPPVALRPWVVSRAWLVAICSGGVLLLGYYLMFFKARLRLLWGVAAAAGLTAAVFAHPSILLLVLQSALSGVILTLLGLLIQRLIERPRAGAAAGPRPGSGAGQGGPGASAAGSVGVGSDDSTAIRVRASSTMDYVSPLALSPEPESSLRSRIGKPG